MGEQLRFSTPDFVNPLKATRHVHEDEGEFGVPGDHYSFGNGKFAELAVSRNKNGELRWANAVFEDPQYHLAFYYDHAYWAEPFNRVFFHDPYAPYKAVIRFDGIAEENGRVVVGAEYGTFHYDATGVLRTIECGSFQYHWSEINVPKVIFQRAENGEWKIFRGTDIQLGRATMLGADITQIDTGLVKDSQPVIMDEIETTITEANERLHLHQKTLTGHKQKHIEVPSGIDLTRWRSILDVQDGSWIQILSHFPSSIQLQV